jgi:hypothetical protein
MARSRIAARPVGLPTARRHRDRLDDPDRPNGVRNIEGRLVRENADGVVPYDRIPRHPKTSFSPSTCKHLGIARNAVAVFFVGTASCLSRTTA